MNSAAKKQKQISDSLPDDGGGDAEDGSSSSLVEEKTADGDDLFTRPMAGAEAGRGNSELREALLRLRLVLLLFQSVTICFSIWLQRFSCESASFVSVLAAGLRCDELASLARET